MTRHRLRGDPQRRNRILAAWLLFVMVCAMYYGVSYMVVHW